MTTEVGPHSVAAPTAVVATLTSTMLWQTSV